jgi:hypothetical protein
MQDGIGSSAVAPLGAPIQDYRVALPARISAGVLSIAGGGFAILFAMLLVFGVQHSPNDGGMAILFDLVFALPTGVLGLFLLWRFIESCTLRATIHSGGISFRTLRYQRSAAWDDVSSITLDAPGPPNLLVLVVILLFCWFLIIPYLYPRLKCSLTLKNGGRIRIPRALARKTSLVDTIDIAVADHQLPDMITRFQNGIPSHFGKFSVEAEGLRAGKKVLPWRDVHLVTRTASGIAVFRKGQQSSWSSAPLKAVPSPTLFQALVAWACEETRG